MPLMSLQRRTPLGRGKPLRRDGEKARAWGNNRKPLRSKPKRRTPEEIRVREAVFARDRYRCLLWGTRRLGTACAFEITPHHLLKEGQGGKYTEENLVTLCSVHNDAVEDHPAEALEIGLVVRPGVDHAEAARRRVSHSVVPR